MLNLTKYEKYVLIFLVLTALIGIGILFYKTASNKVTLEVVHNKDLPSTPQPKQPKVININTATEEELTTLKGIGLKLAAKIVEYRKAHGYFATKEDLKKVDGIGPQKFEEIKEAIRVR